jgi:predicted Rossmann fold nucleotide-binding protein DprA/Smf involved in DNA uptake
LRAVYRRPASADVSGLARGVDALAHTGATFVGGRAIGVSGTGVDVCYPKENKKLSKALEKGAIISERPTGSPPALENFPVRNRIIAGMPLGGVIVEGKPYSGLLITARLAMELGREVLASRAMSLRKGRRGHQLRPRFDELVGGKALPTPIRAALVQAQAVESEQRHLLAADGLTPS